MYEKAFAVLVDDRFINMLRRRIRRERCEEGDDVMMIIICLMQYLYAINFFAIKFFVKYLQSRR
jgi:transposase